MRSTHGEDRLASGSSPHLGRGTTRVEQHPSGRSNTAGDVALSEARRTGSYHGDCASEDEKTFGALLFSSRQRDRAEPEREARGTISATIGDAHFPLSGSAAASSSISGSRRSRTWRMIVRLKPTPRERFVVSKLRVATTSASVDSGT